jgi:putative aldouronate transport system permease protein
MFGDGRVGDDRVGDDRVGNGRPDGGKPAGRGGAGGGGKRSFRQARLADNIYLTAFTLPALILLFIFSYMPMGGLLLSFKDYNYELGILGSRWVGLRNFWIFASVDAFRIIRNTLAYGAWFLAAGTASALFVALLMFEVRSRRALKFYQTTHTIPRFLSWVIVSYITYLFLSPTSGVINSIIRFFGGEGVAWFNSPSHWPAILTVVSVWKAVGLDSIVYYAALMGLDYEQYEAARVDGAGRLQQVFFISLPSLRPTITILCILALGGIFRGDFGLFYQIPRNVGLLYPATDIIDTYIYRGLSRGDIGATAAVGFVQSVVGLAAVLGANAAVRRISPENSLY